MVELTYPSKMPEEKGEKLAYLQRNEVKTMQKDIAELRELESDQEREKISRLKTEEEAQREKIRKEMAQKAALERKFAEEEASRKEEEIKRLRETASAPLSEATAEPDAATAAEEEERKRFLERVETKAEDKEELPSPPPPPPPPPLVILEKKIPKPFFRRPSSFQKLWVRIVLTLLSMAILAAVATFWYWYFNVREEIATALPAAEQEAEQELIIPASLISVEASRILEMPLLDELLKEDLGEGQFTRLIIKDPEKNKVLGLKEFFEAFEVKAPATFYDKVANDFTLFVYSSRGANRLGLITEVKEPDLLPLLKSWEKNMEKDIETLSVFLGKTEPSLISYFRETKYKDVPFRYLSFPPQNFGICWLVTDKYFILTFSGESIIKTIDKID